MTNLKRQPILKMTGRVALSLILVLGVFVVSAMSVENIEPAKMNSYHSSRIIVEAESFEDAQRIAEENNMKIVRSFDAINEIMGTWYGLYEISPSYAGSIADAVTILQESTTLLHAGHDYMYQATLMPNDPQFKDLYGLHNTGQTGGKTDADIDAPEAWEFDTGSNDVIVAVVDSGVDYDHEDLAANMWKNPGEIAGNGIDDDKNGYVDDIYGIDTVNKDSDPADDFNHGSHCAGILGAVGNNGIGITGVNWNVKIMAMKFLDGSGNGPESAAVELMNYLIDQKKKGQNIVVASHSYVGPYDKPLEDAIIAAGKAGIISVAAAGNEGRDVDSNPQYPACLTTEYVISVGGTDNNDAIYNSSNYGKTSVDLAAPATNILSCNKSGGYMQMTGTSMATPHVSGAVALAAARFPSETASQRIGRIMNSVDPVSAWSGKSVTGGRLNLKTVVEGGNYCNAVFSFTTSPDNLTASFADKSTTNASGITAWEWNFGDGGKATTQNPSHTYAKEGTYTVTLKVTDANSLTDTVSGKVDVPKLMTYCESKSGGSMFSNIKQVDIGSYSNPSGAAEYSNFPDLDIRLDPGKSYAFKVSPNTPYGMYKNNGFRVWIDFNRNGSFNDAGELVFEKVGEGVQSGTIQIPSNASPKGRTGMRVSMKNDSVAGSCEKFSYGEVEDYYVRIDNEGPAPTQYDLTVRTSGQGTVTLDPAGGRYDEGTRVTLTAKAAAGYKFSGWSGDLTGTTNPASITMNSNKTVTATFEKSTVVQYDLTVKVVGQGSVTLNPAGGRYDEGTRVTLTPKPGSGYTFSGWSGDLTGSANPASITMNANKSVTATFKQGSDPNSCVGNCGNKAPGGCWCDNMCDQYGDCCADKTKVCGY